MQKASRKTLTVSVIVWFVYLLVLSLGLLWYFPWRGREAQKVPATYDRETLRSGLRAMKASPDYKDSLFAMFDDNSKSEDQELDEMIRSMKKTRNTFRRMPCWRPAGVKDELDTEQTIRPAAGGMATMQIGFKFVAPIRAWDRFGLEFLYGLAGGVTLQIAALSFGMLLRWRRSQKSSNQPSEATR